MDSRLKDSLSSSGDVKFADASSVLPQCIHVLAVKQIVESLDAVDGRTVESDFTGKSYSIHAPCTGPHACTSLTRS